MGVIGLLFCLIDALLFGLFVAPVVENISAHSCVNRVGAWCRF
jgi:hypothetical protein